MQNTLAISERFYEVLLNLYPAQFRDAHAQQMRLSFQAACRDAFDGHGVSGLLALWLPTLFDLFKSALEERSRQGEIAMSKHPLIAWAGPLTIVIGLLWILASIGEFVLLVKWGSPDTFWDLFWFFPVALSFLLMIPAFIAMRTRFQESASEMGRLGLVLNVAGCVGMISFLLLGGLIDMVAPAFDDGEWPNYVIAASFMTPMIGHILFGIDAVKNDLLPRWNIIPVLVGLPSVLLFVPDLLIQPSTPSRFELTLIVTFTRFLLTGIAWVLMGIAMTGRRPAQQEAAASAL